MAACDVNLLQLPPEILLHIFSYLQPEDIISRVRPTCRHFHDLSKMPDLWRSVTVTHISNEASARYGVDRPASRFDCEKFNKKLLGQKCIKSSCGYKSEQKKNQQIQMKVDKVTVNSVITSVEERGNVWSDCSVTGGRCYPSLNKLKIMREWMPSMKFLVYYRGLVHLQLEMAHIAQKHHQDFSEEHITGLLQSLKGLTSLEVLKVKCVCSHCANIVQTSGIQTRIAESVRDYFLIGPRLRQLELSSLLLQNDEIFQTVLDNCLQLKNLALVSPDLTPKAFAAVSKETQKCTGLLSSLRITDCPKLDDTCLEAMSVAFRNLRSLELTLTVKMTDKGVGHLLRTCRLLTFLKLTSPDYEKACADSGQSRKITGDCLKKLAYSGKLQTLVLENFSLLSDPMFKELCRHQPNLHTLELTKCRVTTGDMRTLADSCPLLQTVIITKCSDVDSTAVAFLMQNLPRLHTLRCKFSGQHQFDTGHLQSVRKRTTSGRPVLRGQQKTGGGLRSLELHPCRNFTAAGVSALTLLCPNLNRLHLHAEKFLSKHTIRQILSNCKQLQHLKLEKLSVEIPETVFTEACLNDIQERGTCLQSLHLLARYRTFSLTSLAKLLAQSSTLVDCTVPFCLQNDGGTYSGTKVIKQLNEVLSDLTHQRKKVYGWMPSLGLVDNTQTPLYRWSHLRIRIYSRLPPATKAVK